MLGRHISRALVFALAAAAGLAAPLQAAALRTPA